MTVKELMERLSKMPPEAEVVLDERDSRGGYVWDITSVWPPDAEDRGHEAQVMIRGIEICRHDGSEVPDITYAEASRLTFDRPDRVVENEIKRMAELD